MGVANFRQAALVEIDNRPYKLLRMLSNGLWQIEDEHNGRISEISLEDMERLYIESKLTFISERDYDLENKVSLALRKRDIISSVNVDEAQLKKLKEKKEYINALLHIPTTSTVMTPEIQRVWVAMGSNGKPPHWHTVARWIKKYLKSNNDFHALINSEYLKGNRTRRYPDNVLVMVDDAVEKIYLTRERRTVVDTLHYAEVVVARKNNELIRCGNPALPLPTRRLIQASIDKIDAYDRHAARYGELAARRKYRSVLHMNVTNQPLECAEIDHTMLDLMVVDDETGMPLGRPWVTVCIDRFTRCALGIYIGFEPPSYLTVARCLKHAFLPKVDMRKMYPEIQDEWVAHGVMSKLIVDNGLEFHSISLESACLSLGIDLQFTPRKTPWWKGVVERFIGTMNRGVAHGVPGTTFSNIFDKDEYDPVKNAVISLRVLKLILNKWIVDVYHNKPHQSLENIPPAIKWLSSIKPEEINLPDNPERLDAILGSVDHRTLTHKGIEFAGMYYNSADLAALRRRKGDRLKVEIRVDEGNLGYIYVIAPDNEEIIRVECMNFLYADGLTKWQHKVCQRYARERLDLGDNPDAWKQAKVEIYEIVQRETGIGRKKKLNKKSARFSNNALIQSTSNAQGNQQSAEIFTIETAGQLIESASTVGAKKFDVLLESR